MEYQEFINILKKHKLTIIIVPIVAVIITFLLIRNQPNHYVSQARLATGIVDQTQKVLNDGENAPQESAIAQEFSNLIEMLKSKKVLDQLSYKLILHDLTDNAPYRKPSKLFTQLNASAKQHAIEVYTNLLKNQQALSLFNEDQNGLHQLLISMRYDDQSLLKDLTITRAENSDFIDVNYDSESSNLSAVVVNSLCNIFIDYYSSLVKENQQKAVTFLGALLQEKKDTLNKRMDELKDYKIKHNVFNLEEKAHSIYGQISTYQAKKEEAETNTQATQAAIKSIDDQVGPDDSKSIAKESTETSRHILSLRAQLETLNDEYVKSNFDPRYKAKADSIQNYLAIETAKLSSSNVLSPARSKQGLIEQKQNLQIQNDLAKNSSSSIDKELGRLNTEFNGLVPNEGTIQSLESAVSIASSEYLDILTKYNQTSMVSKFSTQLRILEVAEPGLPQASKKALIIAMSGICSGIVVVLVLFFIFIFDSTIKNPQGLANRTKIPVLGALNKLNGKELPLSEIWENNKTTDETKKFRNLIQSLRYEVDNEISGNKILLINSVEEAEGKTFIALNLAHAYAAINRNVLLIDGNFDSPGITEFAKTGLYLEDFLDSESKTFFSGEKSKLKILGNKGGGISILEITNEQQINEHLKALRDAFDIIIIEAPALEKLNKSKEWTIFSDKILTVFEAGKSITDPYKQNIQYLKSLKNKSIGWVLNLVPNAETKAVK